MANSPYHRLFVPAGSTLPSVEHPAIGRVLALLRECAEAFAQRCRAEPRHERDFTRSGSLLCAVGIGADEAAGFLRALDSELVTLAPDGNFTVPDARACSPNLHLVGREGDGVKLHNEVLIHVAAYGELVLDHDWRPDRLVFDPFFGSDALDIWGFAAGPSPTSWRDGDIVFAAEAKARVEGADGLGSLLRAFEKLNADETANVPAGQRRKWQELLWMTSHHPIELLLVADGVRWRFVASTSDQRLVLEPAA